MNGVISPSVSAGSSQRETSVTCTPMVIVPSGAAGRGRDAGEDHERREDGGEGKCDGSPMGHLDTS